MPTTPPEFITLQEVDSTNNYAMGLLQKGVGQDGAAVFALRQTAGKGRLGARWESSPGKNIVLSLIAEMQWLPLYQHFQLSVATALGCIDFFSQYLKDGIRVKWPNDIFLGDSKAGGVLIENQLKGNLWQWAVIGIGLNINQERFDGGLKATSLKNVTGATYDVPELARQLHRMVLAQITRTREGAFEKQLADYNERLFGRGREARLKKGNVIFSTTIDCVAPSGELVTRDVIERKFVFDEVKWVGISPDR